MAVAERRSLLREFIAELGYDDRLVREDYPVWVTGSTTRPAEIVAFSRPAPQHDMTTAVILGSTSESRSDALELARALASPFTVIAAEQFEVWRTGATASADEQLSALSLANVAVEAASWRARLAPEVVERAKTTTRQLSLIPIDVELLASAERRSREGLTELIEQAVGLVMSDVPTATADPELAAREFDRAARIVVAAVAALMVRDKLDYASADASEQQALAAARQMFPRQFMWLDDIAAEDEARLVGALQILGENVNYAGLSPAVVSHVYESALVDEAVRKDLGVYYTPPELARRISEHIPFEEVAPDDRVVLDPTCGSGTLLLAAYERMQAAAPEHWDIFERHEYLRSHLIGYDADRFAVEIAQLALLVHSMPAGDKWNVEQRDAREPLPDDPRPAVVMSNPPWKYTRVARNEELADMFIRRMIEVLRPDGFLAVILPATWLTSAASEDTRSYLLKHASLFELWRLPEGVFSASTFASSVLFARKNPESRPYVFRRVFRDRTSINAFLNTGVADVQFLVDEAPRDEIRLPGPLDAQRELLERLPTLSSLALVQGGPATDDVKKLRGEGPYLWLRFARRLREFGAVPSEALMRVRYPEDFSRRGADASVYLQPKVLVSATRWSENPWRLKVALDTLGVIPRNSLHMVIPKSGDEDDLYALLALLGSSLASAWVDTYEPSRNVHIRVLKALPMPPRRHWARLAKIGRKLHESAQHGAVDARLTVALEELIVSAYGLDEATISALRAHFADEPAPEGGSRFPAIAAESRASLSDERPRQVGAVLEVGENRLRLWVPGVTPKSGAWVQLPHRFHGWLAEQGATFDVFGSSAGLENARYVYQPKSFRSLEQLVQRSVEREHGNGS
jgi:SAM-dependent methyltransferase